MMISGYPSGGGAISEAKCNPTILSGDIQQDGDLQNNAYHVVTTAGVSDATCIDGFCIRDGNAVYPVSYTHLQIMALHGQMPLLTSRMHLQRLLVVSIL